MARYRAALTTVPGQDWLLACESLGPGRGDYPIDAQPHGSNGFGRATVRNDREDFRPSSIGRTRSGLREVAAPSRTSFRADGRSFASDENLPGVLAAAESHRHRDLKNHSLGDHPKHPRKIDVVASKRRPLSKFCDWCVVYLAREETCCRPQPASSKNG